MLIRVFIVSNFLLLLPWLAKLIESRSEHYSLAGIAETHSQAVQLMANTHVDVVILDIDGNPDEVLVLIETLSIVSSAKVLLLSRLQDMTFQEKAIICGAKGILNHSTTPELLLTAIDKVYKGEMWLNRAATERMLAKLLNNKQSDYSSTKITLLTEREHEIFTFIIHSSGEPAKVIANKLHISESTLRNHLTSIYEKLGVTNRHGLLTFAYQNGLTDRIN
ncbi:Oxygen regulatory protein NreC [Patescibacteria group bacterium]|nr:Oxygen regulatory protein NreC [Patescibacteria group bacterium]